MENYNLNLTYPQKSIWSMEQYYSGTNINNICGTVIIKQKTDLDILNKAINIFIKNNKSFQLNFEEKDGDLIQYFTEYKYVEFKRVNLKNDEDVRKLGIKTSEHIFNITDQRLYNFILFKLENGYGGFVILNHHIISDASTMSMVSEIVENYSNLLKNNEIPEKNYSYEDYINSEKEYLKSNKFIEDEKYWNDLYSTIPEVATIPSSLEVTSNSSISAKRKEYLLNSTILSKIADFCSQNKVSNFNFFMAVYAIYLSRVSNLEDFAIGTPILNRTTFNEKHTSGMFINTAPFRINLENDCDFVNFVKQLAKSSYSMLKHQKYPYENLLKNLRKKQSDLPPLYDVMLSYQVTKANNREIDIPYEIEWLPTSTISNGIYIHLHDNNSDGNLHVAYDYQVAKYEETDIDDMHKRILHIINQILENSSISTNSIEIVTPEEKHKILYEFNNTTVPYPKDKTIVDLFEEQVEKTPDNIAVVFEDQKLTYRELNEKANQLAHYLIDSQTANQNSIICVFMNKNINYIISILGILKAGYAFCPINIAYPKERLLYIVNNSNANLILSEQSNLNIKNNLNFNNIDLNKYSKNNLNIYLNNTDLVYSIYTSGSTGNPKGVMIQHKNLINFLYSFNDCFNNKFNINDNCLSLTNISFDVSICEIFTPLLFGASLILYNEETLTNLPLLVDTIIKQKITFLYLPPNILDDIYNYIYQLNLKTNINKLLVGVEAIKTSTLNNFFNLNKNIEIINGYGPTETTICCTFYKFQKNKCKTSIIPIGKPLNNNNILILDTKLSILPINFKGYIYVSGENVSKGYLNNEELTNQSFLKINNSIYYNTGDIGYFDNNGNIHFVCRKDNQVKIHGYRIELGEINNTIKNIDNVLNAYTTIKNFNNSQYICSYVVANNLDEIKIKNILNELLPYYMIPQHIIFIDSMPLTTNGKIDKNKLPEITLKNDSSKTSSKSLTKTEKNLKIILQSLLKNDCIFPNDNIFDLGADSLTVIKLITEISLKLNKKLISADIFNNPTIEKLGNIIDSYPETNLEIDSLEENRSQLFYPLTSAQKRIYYSSSLAGNNSTLYNISGGIIFNEILDSEKLENAFKILIQRHEVFRTYFELSSENGIIQKISNNIDFTLNTFSAKYEDIDVYFKRFVRAFDLSKAPLLRAEFIKFENEKSMLLFDSHHIILDGISLNIFLKELSILYNGKQLPISSTITYKDFAIWENNNLSNLNKAKKFWLKQFESDPPILNLPTTYKTKRTQYIGSTETFQIETKLKNKINKISKDFKCTNFMIYLTAYFILLEKYTKQKDIIIGTPVSGRYLPEFSKDLSQIIGMFVNTLPLRFEINSKLPFSKILNEIQKMCLNAFDNQQYPLENITNTLNNGERNLFNTMFIYQNIEYPKLKFGNSEINYYIPKSNVAKFDISLELLPNQNNLDLNVEYNTELFSKNYVNNLITHYIQILNTLCQNPDIIIDDINIFSEYDKNLLDNLNNTNYSYRNEKNVIQTFEEIVQKNPSNIALIFQGQKITYKELNQKANALANKILEKNIEKNEVIGIFLSRSENIIVSMLAILKVGCTYMIIDTNLPNDRVKYMLTNSNSNLLITEESANYIKIKNKILIETIDKNSKIENPNIITDISNNFNVIYTSGSTGTPKGILTTNKGFLNLKNSYKNIFNANKYETFLSICSISFDMFSVEIFLPLLLGKTIVLTDEEQHKSPIDINNLIKKYNIEVMFITPSKCELLLQAPNFNNLKYLKNIQFGGEIFKPYIWQKLKNISENIEIYNEYGPSEITSCCSIKHIEQLENITIGKPINNTKIYILNEQNKLCPINIPGEIGISGDGVSLGYINNNELTAKSFIPNPFENGIIYKSGDIGILNENGELEYIDRQDSQIKIRGLRIELSEIEKQILNIPEIQNCAVIHNKNQDCISAFILSNSEIDINELKKKIAEKLPVYMIPKYITQLDNFPLTRNGKIDKKALENFKIKNQNVKKYVAPISENEKLICKTWSKLLDKKIGMEDNVFECGADSLLAIKFKTELLAHDIRILYADIFKYKIIKDFCNNSNISKNIESNNYDYTQINKVLSQNTISDNDNIQQNKNNNIILLGATGFVGAHILYNFIKYDKGIAYCLVRKKGNESGKTRLINRLNFYFGDKLNKYIDKRIFIINGNILQENLNFSNKQIELFSNVNTIINCAALVKHFGEKQDFNDINVKSISNIVDFCKDNNKRFIHLSTLSVSGNSILENENNRIQTENKYFTEKDLYIGQSLENLYVKSKFEAEKLILSEIANGLNAQILRLGNITNRYSDGKFQINKNENAFANKIDSFIRLKCIPDYLSDLYLEFTPVDICADAIIKILQNYTSNYNVFHIYNNNHIYIDKFIEYLQKNKIDIQLINENDFKNTIKNMLKESPDSLKGIINDINENQKISYDSNIHITSEFTRKFLYKLGFEWPNIDEKYIRKYIINWRNTNE